MLNKNAALFNDLFANRPRRTVITGKIAITTGVIGKEPRVYTTSTGKYVDGTEKSAGDALLPNRIWVHDLNKTKNEVVLNKQVQYISNLTVELELNTGGEWEVLGADVVQSTATFGTALSTVSSPEQVGTANADVVSARRIKPLRVKPAAAGGLYVTVEAGFIRGQYWNGGDLDLSTAQSGIGSSMKAWVVIAYDVINASLIAAAGSDNSLFATMLPQDIVNVSFTGDVEILAAYPLTDTDTTIDASKIVDTRAFVNSTTRPPIDISDVSSPPTDAELDAAFGTPANVGKGFFAFVDDNDADTAVYLAMSNGTSWWYVALTKAT